ncbi:MAG: universal stress protein [Gammaproteobacteria bacterium]
MRVFLVPVANRPECATALKTAFDLARRMDASVEGYHMRPNQGAKVALPDDLSAQFGGDALWHALARGKSGRKWVSGARGLFEEVAEHYDFDLAAKPSMKSHALWAEKVGSPEKLLAIHGPVSDLIVVSRPSTRRSKLAGLFLQSAVLGTSRPVLIVPPRQAKPIGAHIAIGWNRSAEAAASVAAALPLLQKAERVTILRGGPSVGAGPSSAHLAQYLKFYGINAKRVKASQKLDDTEAIMTAYNDVGADLLVIGAYSRSRLRQRLLGGVTEFMLHKAKIPVLLKHH